MNNMKRSESICEEMKKLERDLEYYKKKTLDLTNRIDKMIHISDIYESKRLLEILNDLYTKEEIALAYEQAIEYEGLKSREESLIIDTFIEFLTKKHSSLNER